jgi:hypothetical protein
MRRKLVSRVAAAAVAGALLAAGCASAATTTGATTAASTTAAGGTAAGGTAAGGPAHFIADSKYSDGPDFTAIVTGAIGDYGLAVTVHPDGTVDPEHSSELSLRLRHGTFRLNIANLDKKFVHEVSQFPANQPTCSFYGSVTAVTPVVAGSGTGSYRGISGSLTMTIAGGEVDVKPCPHGTSGFLSQLIFLTGSGTVSFG